MHLIEPYPSLSPYQINSLMYKELRFRAAMRRMAAEKRIEDMAADILEYDRERILKHQPLD